MCDAHRARLVPGGFEAHPGGVRLRVGALRGMSKLPFLAATLSLFVFACSTSVAPDLVRAKAASDLGCASGNVNVEKINDGNWKATGCNQAATYVCSGSNFMSSGMCMREGTIPTSATMTK